ncbi:MAG: ester cyclase [Anaerolineae bacterium]
MSVEEVAREFVSKMTDEAAVRDVLAPDATVSGGILPAAMPAMEAFRMIGGLQSGFPDIRFEPQNVSVNGDQATVDVKITGTNTGAVTLPVPGMAGSIPPTGRKVSVMDRFVITVRGDKIAQMYVDSPAGGGIPGVLEQLGVNRPGM